MADRYRLVLAAAAGCLVALLLGCAAVATGPVAPGPPPDPPAPATGGTGTVRVLQLNLCNSGIAACYTGRATAAAAAVIRAEQPDLITLNEICEDDLPALQQALADARPDGAAVASAFQPARNARTGDAYRCRNGRHYGIGIVSRRPSAPASAPDRGIYPAQDAEDPEQRAWLCLDATAPALTVCTTHLAYTERAVAVAQCRYLFDTVIAGVRARDRTRPVVLGGDLNLGAGNSPDLRSCLPAGSGLVDDGGQQHVVATPGFVIGATRTIDLHGATDHPALLVTLGLPPARRAS